MRISKAVAPEFLTAGDAVDRIPDRARVLVEASGGGVIEPSGCSCTGDRYHRCGAPGELSVYFCSGIGDRNGVRHGCPCPSRAGQHRAWPGTGR